MNFKVRNGKNGKLSRFDSGRASNFVNYVPVEKDVGKTRKVSIISTLFREREADTLDSFTQRIDLVGLAPLAIKHTELYDRSV